MPGGQHAWLAMTFYTVSIDDQDGLLARHHGSILLDELGQWTNPLMQANAMTFSVPRTMPLPTERLAFIGNFLGDDWKPIEPFADNFEVVRFLSQLAKSDLGGSIERPSDEGDTQIARMMAAETIYAIERRGNSSSGWYTESLRKAFLVIATMHPELASDDEARAIPNAGFSTAEDAKTVLISAMAITSQNIRVTENLQFALEQYRHFVERGEFVPTSYGARGQSVSNNLARFNQVLSAFQGDIGKLRTLLKAEFTMGEFRSAAAKFGISIGGSELVDEKVYGSMIFGPKIGNGFLQNLMGNYEPITIDLWFMRMWGRYTGTLVSDTIVPDALPRMARGVRKSMRSKKMAALFAACGVPHPREFVTMKKEGLLDASRSAVTAWERARRALIRSGKDNAEISLVKARLEWPGAAESIVQSLGLPVDAPKSAGTRRWIRSVSLKAIDILMDSGYEISAADMQATLWYPEKELYDRLAGRRVGTLNVSYDIAAATIARREGVSDERIERILRSARRNGTERSRNHPSDGRGDAGTDRCPRQRASGARGKQDARRDQDLSPPIMA